MYGGQSARGSGDPSGDGANSAGARGWGGQDDAQTRATGETRHQQGERGEPHGRNASVTDRGDRGPDAREAGPQARHKEDR